MSLKKKELIDQLLAILPEVQHQGGSGENLNFPKFDFSPSDYLNFAETGLSREVSSERINCIANLKRAVDCELDTFLTILNLKKNFDKNGLRFSQKMDFIKSIGIVSPHSLNKLNTIRNKLEHEYSNPRLEDVELYFDLCASFVGMVDGYIFMIASNSLMEFYDNSIPSCQYGLSLEYRFTSPCVAFEVQVKDAKQKKFLFKVDEREDFGWAMKIYLLLCRSTGVISIDRVIAELKSDRLRMENKTVISGSK